jgi:hypothetical protein
MASTSEVGHAKNIANFKVLITYCTNLGAVYAPSNTVIALPAINAVASNAETLVDSVDTSSELYHSAVGIKRNEFDPLKKFATRLINAYIAVSPSKQKIANAKSINAKIQGIKLKQTKTELPTNTPTTNTASTERPIAPIIDTPKDISASQQSYDQLVEHFSKLLVLLAADPLFTPAETELQVSSLNAKLLALKTAISNFVIAYTQVTNTRIARNHSLYDDNTGLCDIAQTIKSYLISVYGATSQEYKAISGLAFKKLKN